MRRAFFALSLTLTLTPTLRAQQQHVAPTDPLSPADERRAFTVPAGFEVQLVAAEPDIQKPMQIAFDARGRLWVTTSHLYPFPAPPGKGTDKLFVLSDFGPDGKARKVQVFADTLNIPIGVLPLPDCNSCLVSSAGVILKLTDTDGDGKADKTEDLFTGFGFKDTHGMVNSFTLLPDGWVYACHGFANESTVKGKDGHEVKMHSGHTFRFRPDGSRIEVFTRGQVNPFGIAVDPWFNLYTADCHTKPITQLIPGAYYDSFGKPHDGLGYGPHVTRHDHKSTALCGLAWYDADHFPKEYKGTMFLGNVVTNRINFDRIEWQGSTPVARELPDFLVSKDPWFRPTDVKLGPDGALYVADFYNRIVGHYEVDLKHPGRDKDRGRVWRVVWKGEPGASATGAPKMPFTDLTKEEMWRIDRLLLGHPNITTRHLALLELLRRKPGGVPPSSAGPAPNAYSQGAWLWWREAVMPQLNLKLTGPTRGSEVPIAAIRVLTARTKWDAATREAVCSLLTPDTTIADGFHRWSIVRAAVEALAFHPHPDNVKPLVELIQKVPADDAHLKHAARVALRNQLRDAAGAWEAAKKLPADAAPVLGDVALGVPGADAAGYLGGLIRAGRVPGNRLAASAEHIGRHGRPDDFAAVIESTRKGDGPGSQVRAMTTLHALVRGLQAGGKRLTAELQDSALTRVRAELEGGTRESRLAALRLLADLPGVLEHRFRGNEKVDPVPLAARLLTDSGQGDDLRAAALDALVKLDAKFGFENAASLLDAPPTPPALREKAALVLAASADRNHKQAANDAIKAVPYRSGVVIAVALAGSRDGAGILLAAVKQGKAPARLLQEKLVLERLRAAGVPDLDEQIGELTRGLPPADQKLAVLIKQRTARFASAKPDKELGAKLFTKHCAACHQVGGQGGKVAPQLDGIGNRGLERLLEDTLDPNRNVDAEFRARVLSLADGRTLTGLMLRVEGEVVVFADDQGKEFRVPTKDIERNRETALSPMPANFGEVVPEADFFHLIAYLLDQKAKDPPPKK
jgi:putative heme-binding domain-containing protein